MPEPIKLYEPPAEEVLVLGEMMRGARLLGRLLKELPLSGAGGYHGALRVILAETNNLKLGALRLLGNDDGFAVPDPTEAFQASSTIIDNRAVLSTRTNKRGRGRKPKAADDPRTAPTEATADDGKLSQQRTLEILAKKPATPLELCAWLGLAKTQPNMVRIYAMTNVLKGKGLIERHVDDEADGQSRWRVVK